MREVTEKRGKEGRGERQERRRGGRGVQDWRRGLLPTVFASLVSFRE